MGRQAELARAREAVARASVGSGCAVVITGEPGIGKTMLAQEVLRQARSRAFHVLEGRCDALSESLAYAPVVEAVGRALRDLSLEERAHIVDGLSVLAKLIPGLDLPARRVHRGCRARPDQALRVYPARA